jgi:hypothetical protein
LEVKRGSPESLIIPVKAFFLLVPRAVFASVSRIKTFVFRRLIKGSGARRRTTKRKITGKLFAGEHLAKRLMISVW